MRSGLLLIALLLLLPVVRAADSDSDLVADELEDRTERALSVRAFPEGAPTALYVRSEAREGGDAFEMDWSKGRMSVGYLPDVAGTPAVTLGLAFGSLVEFTDADGDGAPGPDEVERTVDLRSGYSAGAVEESILQDGGKVVAFTIRRDPVAFRLEVTSRFTTVDGRPASPVEVRLAVTVDHANRFSGTRVALAVDVLPSEGSALRPYQARPGFGLGADEQALSTTSGGEELYLAWDGVATADGTEAPVIAPIPVSTTGEGLPLVFAYPRAELLRHSLRIGVVSEAHAAELAAPSPEVTAGAYALTLGLAATIVVATALRRRAR